MKKKNLFAGITQIVLSAGIFCGGGVMYYLKTHKSDYSKTRLSTLKKQAEVMQDICSNLHTTNRNLHTTNRNLQTINSNLQTTHRNLQTTHRNLQITHRNLQTTHRNLQTTHRNLQITHRNLQTTHSNLQTTHSNLQTTHSNLQTEFLYFRKTLPLHEKVFKSLNNALDPLKHGVDTIVELREYTIMKKKPFYALGNSFAGFQKSIGDVKDALKSAESNFHQMGKNKKLIQTTENSLAALDKNSIAALDKNSIAALDKNSIATLDKNSIAALDKNSIAALDKSNINATEKNIKAFRENHLKVFDSELAALEYENKKDMYNFYCLLGMFALIGIGFLGNGIWLCCEEK